MLKEYIIYENIEYCVHTIGIEHHRLNLSFGVHEPCFPDRDPGDVVSVGTG